MALIEIVAEYNLSTFFVLITRPFLMPLLILMYLIKRQKPRLVYVASLLFAWLSDIFLMFSHHNFVLLGVFFSVLFFTTIIYLIYRTIKLSSLGLLIISCIPFLLAYVYISNVAYEQLEEFFYLFILQSLSIIFLGGYALSSYIRYPNRSNTYLFISIALFIVSQFVIIFKSRISIQFFQPIQTVFYVFAQYVFYEFVVFDEKRRRYYEIKNAI